jgi:hypothetical protein
MKKTVHFWAPIFFKNSVKPKEIKKKGGDFLKIIISVDGQAL